MKSIKYYFAKVCSKIIHSEKPLIDYYKSIGIIIGDNCLICSYLGTREPEMISIGNNVVISTNVTFCSHDNSARLVFGDRSDLFGRIVIGNNCFIGQNAILMYGVQLSDSIIVAAGAVVTKSFDKSNIIIGGNPARIIGTWDSYKEKYNYAAINRKDYEKKIKYDDSFLVKK